MKPTHTRDWSFLSDVPGWCPPEKAQMLYDTVVTYRPELCVEIGVYGGRSLLAIALGLQENGCGVVCGVDPYEVGPTQEGASLPESEHWWRNEDFQKRLWELRDRIAAMGLGERIRLTRKASRDAVADFAPESIDLLHIDGNHSTESAKEDVRNYLPLLKPGGWLVMDDTNWHTVIPALNDAKAECDLECDCGLWCFLRKRSQSGDR